MKSTNVSALDVARAFVHIANSDQVKRPITNKKLQKLVYYAQVWHYVNFDEPLFSDKIEAWVHGPVVRSVYNAYKHYQFGTIPSSEIDVIKNLPSNAQRIINAVWGVYGKYDADYLEVLTHSERPWQDARDGVADSERCTTAINMKSAKAFYKERQSARKNG